MLKIIQNDTEYKSILQEVEELLEKNPEAGSLLDQKLGVLLLLVKDYESKKYQASPPDPIGAIRFRMEQQDLSQRDMIPYIGSRSKVSEVLSGKRRLTLDMIRALEAGLGIPAHVLLQENKVEEAKTAQKVKWSEFPLKEMANRGWIKKNFPEILRNPEKSLNEFFSILPNRSPTDVILLTKKTNHTRSGHPMNKYALIAWATRIIHLAQKDLPSTKFKPGSIDIAFMRRVVQLSPDRNGPKLAQNFLRDNGIALVVERHLPRTYLDGATITLIKDHPVIGLTLRYDRIDNFWFCLMHELAHISKHFDQGFNFFDDLEVPEHQDHLEKETDSLAGEALIPHNVWITSPASLTPAPDAVYSLANKLGIHPAIVAGRMRRERKAYKLLSQYVGYYEVRKHFKEVSWED